MRQMGVRPLGPKDGQQKSAPAERPLKSASLPIAPVDEPHKAAVALPVDAAESSRADLNAQIQKLQQEVLRRGSAVEDLQRELSDLKVAFLDLENKSSSTKSGRVARLLQERGFVDRAQQEDWLSALVGKGKGHLLLAQFESVNEASFARFLDGSVYMHCGRDACLGPPHLVPVTVVEDRCEICGGGDLAALGEHLSSHLLLAGIRKIYFRSQRLALLRWFASTLDPRIEARVAPVDVKLQLGPEVGPIVLWRQGGEASEVEADFRIKADSLAQMVTRLCYKLDQE